MKISGKLGTVRSRFTLMRPLRSASVLVRSASFLPNGVATTPPAHSTVLAASVSCVSPRLNGTPLASMFVTMMPLSTSTPSRVTNLSALADRSSGKGPKTRGAPSIKIIRASCGLILRKSWRSVSRAISASAPESSRPVAPAPTMTNVSHARASSKVAARSARSNA